MCQHTLKVRHLSDPHTTLLVFRHLPFACKPGWHSAVSFRSRTKKNIILSMVRIKDLDKLNLLKLAYGDLVLGLSQFFLLPQLPQNKTLASKLLKSDSKITILLHWSKYMTHSVHSLQQLRQEQEGRSLLIAFEQKKLLTF